MVSIVGIMRFSVVTQSHKRGYRAVRDLSLDDALAKVLDPVRLERRMSLVELMPLASLSAQTDRDFVLHMLISRELQEPFKKRIYGLQSQLDYLNVIEVGVHEHVQEHLRGLVQPGEPTVTFRLDDDDAVGPQNIADLRAMAVPQNEGKLLTHPRGVFVMPKNGKLVMQEVSYPNNSCGIGYLSSRGDNVFSVGSHSGFSAKQMVRNDRARAWIRSIHGDSDSGSLFQRGIPVRDVTPDALRDFGEIDFAALGDVLGEARSRRTWRLQLGGVDRPLR